jgi:hypothetical protein
MEDTYKLMSQDKVHYYCGRCDKVVGKILKTVLEVQTRQKKLEEEFHRMQQDIDKRNYVKQEQLEGVVLKIGKRDGRGQAKSKERAVSSGER